MGWAISKTHTASTRLSKKVKEYLTGKFVIGERTGHKADPFQVEKDMRTGRNPSNERQFSCTNSDTRLLLPSCYVATQSAGLTWHVMQWKQNKMQNALLTIQSDRNYLTK